MKTGQSFCKILWAIMWEKRKLNVWQNFQELDKATILEMENISCMWEKVVKLGKAYQWESNEWMKKMNNCYWRNLEGAIDGGKDNKAIEGEGSSTCEKTTI